MRGFLRLVGILIAALGGYLIWLTAMSIVAYVGPYTSEVVKGVSLGIAFFGPWILLGLHLAFRRGRTTRRHDRILILVMLLCVVQGVVVLITGTVAVSAQVVAALFFWLTLTFALPAAMVWTPHTRG